MASRYEQVGVVIVAGGSGSRMKSTTPKQFLLLGGVPILARTVNRFAEALPGAQLVVVLPADHIAFWHDCTLHFAVADHEITCGGATRYDSVRQGLAILSPSTKIIAVHDGVRPLISVEAIRRIVEHAQTQGSAIPVVSAVDSYRLYHPDGSSAPIDRTALRIVQTPQVFCADTLRTAYTGDYRATYTDDATVVESLGQSVYLVEGERCNLKITTPEDLTIAEAVLREQKSKP